MAVLALLLVLTRRRRRTPPSRQAQPAEPGGPAQSATPTQSAAPAQSPEPDSDLAEAWVQFLRDHVTQAANGLNNRLAAIAGLARSAAGADLTEAQRADIERIEAEIRAATEITGSLLSRVSSEAPETAPPAWNLLRDSPVRTARILVVEDDDSNRNVVSKLFRKLGHSVIAVANGYEAFDTLQREEVDCIICDLHMPTLGGKTLFEQMENKNPDMAHRFVFVTGDYTRPESFEFLKRSGRPVVGKPYEIDQLLSAVATVLGEVGVIVNGARAAPDEQR